MPYLCSICSKSFEERSDRLITAKVKRINFILCSEECLKKINKPRHKFNAVTCERDGKRFSSKLERRYYDTLKLRQESGEVVFFLCQIPFDLGGNVRYVCDFAVFLSDGTVEFIDTKGRDTAMSIAKRKIVEDKYPIKIKIVK